MRLGGATSRTRLRMIRRSSLEREDAGHAFGPGGVAREPIDRLGRKNHQPALSQAGCSLLAGGTGVLTRLDLAYRGGHTGQECMRIRRGCKRVSAIRSMVNPSRRGCPPGRVRTGEIEGPADASPAVA